MDGHDCGKRGFSGQPVSLLKRSKVFIAPKIAPSPDHDQHKVMFWQSPRYRGWESHLPIASWQNEHTMGRILWGSLIFSILELNKCRTQRIDFVQPEGRARKEKGIWNPTRARLFAFLEHEVERRRQERACGSMGPVRLVCVQKVGCGCGCLLPLGVWVMAGQGGRGAGGLGG